MIQPEVEELARLKAAVRAFLDSDRVITLLVRRAMRRGEPLRALRAPAWEAAAAQQRAALREMRAIAFDANKETP